MSKDKWLRVRLNDEQDEKLDRYTSVRGISRSDLIREIIDSMPTQPSNHKLEFNFNQKSQGVTSMEITDKLGNRFVLSIEHRPQFDLWRIAINKLKRFNMADFVASADLVKEPESKKDEIWLNTIQLDKSNNYHEAEQYLWEAIKKLAKQEGWSRLYGELTLEQIENHPQLISWLKQKAFNLESKSSQQNLDFSIVLNGM